MTQLKFFGGVNEVGGNKFLLEDGKARVFLDFGKNFTREGRFFDEPWISPREVEHLLELGLLPNLPGLYKHDETHETAIDAVLISHPHTDHYDAIRWLRDAIPAYGTEAARAVILAREYAGGGSRAKEYKIGNWTKTDGPQPLRTLAEIRPGRPIEIAGLTVTAFEVDHSVAGAVGYVVETSAGNVAYSGDFRLHGPRGKSTQDFLDAARAHDPAAFLIEGTHVEESRVASEKEVQEKVHGIVEQTRGLVVTGFAVADIDRLTTFYNVARETDRTLVMTTKQAFLADQVAVAGASLGFDLNSETVRFYRKEKKTTYPWEDYLHDKYPSHVTDAADVREAQGESILVASLTDMLALPAIDPVPGSVYIQSSSEPFSEEMEISQGRLEAWLERFGLPLFQIHASGHATVHDLRHAVETVRARRTYLVHTSNAILYQRFLSGLGFETVAPVEGTAYPI